MKQLGLRACLTAALVGVFSTPLAAQAVGSIRGKVTMQGTESPLHGANVVIVELGRSVFSGDDGAYLIEDVPAGTYHVLSHLDSLFTEESKEIQVVASFTFLFGTF